ncbi:MAG TPA: nuclear transport factor 2 family protein [Rhizobiaceae bacterium]|nr:nuclear transport factor 2 family protein [Rhizobiaceae bacterium]
MKPKTSDIPELQYLLDRQAIRDCVNRYARAVDRHDTELMMEVYHADAIDEHGPFRGSPIPFAEWANSFHAEGFASHTHHITTHNCEIDGDTAHAESYCFYVLRRRERAQVILGGGRYIDRLEKRDGEWRIALRKLYIDWRAEADATIFLTPNGYPEGMRDRSDPSYQRPLMPSD